MKGNPMFLGAYGTVADAVVMVDRKTGRSRGFGFIRFAHGRQGALAAEAVLRDFEEHWLEGAGAQLELPQLSMYHHQLNQNCF